MRAPYSKLKLGLVLTLYAMATTTLWASSQDFFRIATGTTVGTAFPIGRVIASAITNPPGSRACEDGGSCGVPGLIAVAHSTLGPLQNIEMIGRGMIESGFVQADLAASAFYGEGVFRATGRMENLRAITHLYSESVQILVSRESRARSVADLEGLRISLGTRESGVPDRALAILEAYGIGVDDFIKEFNQPAQAADRLRDNRLDAIFIVDAYPVPVVADLVRDGLIDILPLDGPASEGLLERNSHFHRATIPADVYRGIGARVTLSVASIWVTSGAVADTLVYEITRSLWRDGNRAMLDGGHPKGRQIQMQRAVEGLTVPLHDGAMRYYRERGVLK